MTKLCTVCGGVIESDDWYSFIRTKYCTSCKKSIRRMKEAERLRALREKRRKENKLTRELCTAQQKELELLRAELIRQRERVAALEHKTS